MRLIERSPGWWADRIAGEPDVPITAGRPAIETEPTARPAPWVAECWRQFLQAAIDAGEFTPPEGETAEGVATGLRLSPAGSVTVLGEGSRAGARERGYIVKLGDEA
ncbi:hypothetical protein [Methylorubrum sp. DB1722]|uniref:hypothetical protein n=1 Tax=Methylorubrum sp. DB1722 TaxID=2478916 RepID=UPI0018E35858|nr:hypothetical protein [Methylorubrum sp. DB1722]MBI1689485.1 hypothetical protein [Methylorubrum sp. DB1722]